MLISDLLASPSGNSASYLTPLDRDKLGKIPEGAELIPVTTRARDSSSTKKLLQAAAMRDHTVSSDHDTRYYTKAQVDNLVIKNTINIPSFKLNREASVTYAVTIPGAVVGDGVIINPPASILGSSLSVSATVNQPNQVALAITNTAYVSVFNGGFNVPGGDWVILVLK